MFRTLLHSTSQTLRVHIFMPAFVCTSEELSREWSRGCLREWEFYVVKVQRQEVAWASVEPLQIAPSVSWVQCYSLGSLICLIVLCSAHTNSLLGIHLIMPEFICEEHRWLAFSWNNDTTTGFHLGSWRKSHPTVLLGHARQSQDFSQDQVTW